MYQKMGGKDMVRKYGKPLLYIVYFFVGTFVFLHMVKQVSVPVYITLKGEVAIEGEMLVLRLTDYDGTSMPSKIYYYVNREEWVEEIAGYQENGDIYKAPNIHKLAEKAKVSIDIEVEQKNLFDVIFKENGNV